MPAHAPSGGTHPTDRAGEPALSFAHAAYPTPAPEPAPSPAASAVAVGLTLAFSPLLFACALVEAFAGAAAPPRPRTVLRIVATGPDGLPDDQEARAAMREEWRRNPLRLVAAD